MKQTVDVGVSAWVGAEQAEDREDVEKIRTKTVEGMAGVIRTVVKLQRAQ